MTVGKLLISTSPTSASSEVVIDRIEQPEGSPYADIWTDKGGFWTVRQSASDLIRAFADAHEHTLRAIPESSIWPQASRYVLTLGPPVR